MCGNSRCARSRRLSGRRCTCALRPTPKAQTALSFLSAYCEEPSAASLSACSCLKTKRAILADAAQRHKQPNSAAPLLEFLRDTLRRVSLYSLRHPCYFSSLTAFRSARRLGHCLGTCHSFCRALPPPLEERIFVSACAGRILRRMML